MKIIKNTIIVLSLILIGSFLSILLSLEKEDYSDSLVWLIHTFSDYQVETVNITSIDISDTVTIVANNIKLETRSGDQNIKIAFAEVKFSLLSILSDRLDIKKLTIKDANIIINNQIDVQTSKSVDFFIPIIEQAELINVHLACQCQNNKSLELKLDDINLSESLGEMIISGSGEFEQSPFKVSGSLGGPVNLIQKEQPFPVDMALQFYNSSFLLQGSIEDPIELDGINMTFAAETAELTNITQHFTADMPNLGSAQLNFALIGDMDDLRISDLQASLKNRSGIDIKANGSINDVLDEFEAELHLVGTISQPSLIELLSTTRSSVIPTTIQFDSQITTKNNLASIEEVDLQLSFDNEINMAISGTGQFDFKGLNSSNTKLNLVMAADSESSVAITTLLKQQLPDLGPVSMNAKVVLLNKAVHVDDINIIIGSEEQLHVISSGRIETFTFDDEISESVLNLDIALSGKNVGHLLPKREELKQFSGIDLLTAKLNISGSLNHSMLNVENVTISHHDGITLRGYGHVKFGNIVQTNPVENILFNLQSHVKKMVVLSPWVETKLPLLGDVRARATIHGQGQQLSFKDLKVTVGDESSLLLTAEGAIDNIHYSNDVRWSGLSLDAKFQAQDLDAIANYLEFSLPDIKQADGNFTLSGDSESLGITALNFSTTNLTGIQLTGSGSIKQAGLLPNNQLSGINIGLTANAESNTSISSFIGQQLPDFGRLNITATLRERRGELGLEGIVLTVGNSGSHAIHLTGQIHDILDDHKLSLSAQLETEVSILLKHILDRPIPDLGIMTGNILISNHDGSLGIERLELSSASPGLYKLTANGAFDAILDADELKFNLDLTVQKPQLLGDKLGIEFADLEAIRFIGQLQGDNEHAIFKGEIDIGQTHFKSDLVASYINEKPALKGTITTAAIDLKDLAIHHEKLDFTTANTTDDKVFSSEIQPFDLIKMIDLDLHFSADEIKGSKFTIDSAVAKIRIQDDILTINPASLIFDDGFVNLNTRLALDTELPHLTFELQANDIDIGHLSSQLLKDPILDGDLTIHTKFTGTGYSIADISSSMDGNISTALDNGILHEDDLALLKLDFLGWFFDHLIQKDQTDIHCAMSHYQLQNGMANLKMLMVTSPDLEASGNGNINLKDETIDLTIHIDNKSIFKPQLPITVTGSLVSPTVTILPDANTLTSVVFSVVPQFLVADIVLSTFWDLLNEGEADSKCEEFLP